MSHYLLSAMIRMAQGLAMSAPTLLVGLLIAAVFRYYLTPTQLRKLFGGESLLALPISWLIGMLLPVCSIGVLPILIEMHRAKVRPGAMTAFALSAPLFNPLSLLYGLTLSRPIVVIAFALCSLLVVTLLGSIWDWYAARKARTGEGSTVAPSDSDLKESQTSSSTTDDDLSIIGIKRLAAMMLLMTRQTVGETGVLFMVALLGLGLLGAFLPYGALQTSFETNDAWAPARMTMLAIPIYATPMNTMSQLGMMFQHGNSPGAALSLLLLGTGVNLATLLWLVMKYGVRSTTIWFVSLIAIVLGLSYAVERPLILPGAEAAGHTHAFDGYASPLHSVTRVDAGVVKELILKPLGIAELLATGVLAGVAMLGLLFRLVGLSEASIKPSAAAPLGKYDRVVPAPVLAFTVIIGLVAFSVVACFAYYPHPNETLEEIATVRSEVFSAARSGNAEQALHWIALWDDWSRRMEVATFMRTGKVRPYQRVQGYLLRKKLELLEHELEEVPLDREHTNRALNDLLSSDERWRTAFRPLKKP